MLVDSLVFLCVVERAAFFCEGLVLPSLFCCRDGLTVNMFVFVLAI